MAPLDFAGGHHVHRVCADVSATNEHQCGLDSEHAADHRCPCGETWWQ